MSRKFVCTANEPIVQTAKGKLRGFILDEIYTFHGIKYANAKRWQMPTEVEPWDGVKDSLNYGQTCPTNGNPNPSSEVYITHRFWPQNEACQYLNIWTKSVDVKASRPVMLWLHGGGYSDGSSIEQAAYDGDRLAKYGDVVVVTLNHRLNILGYLDMSSFGEEYRNSANVGMGDIVEALKWIEQNITAFGGDPENVTVFGQSGGGGKVCSLLQIPSAAGLFHKAVLMSGGAGTMNRKATAHRPIILEMLKNLHLAETDIDKFAKVPYSQLIRAYNLSAYNLDCPLNWEPIADDWYLGHPLNVGFSDYAKKVPVMVGSMVGEFTFKTKLLPDGVEPTEEKMIAALCEKYGKYTDAIIQDLKDAYPNMGIADIVKLDAWARPGVIKFMEAHDEQCEALGYCYMQSLVFPMFGGAPSWHCADIPFVFHNIDKVPCYGIGAVADRLQDEISGAFASFAHTGNPNHQAMPQWLSYTKGSKATMVFDTETECKSAHDHKLMDDIQMSGGATPFTMGKRIVLDEDDTRDWMY